MFSFRCSRCGHKEIVHLPENELQENFTRGLWPDEEYQEDGPTAPDGRGGAFNPENQTLEEMKGVKKDGYRHTLKQCRGFLYKQSERDEIISIFCRKGETVLEYLPKKWQKMAERKLAEIQEE